MNTNNLAQKTNFVAGSDKFGDLLFYIVSLNVPGISLNPVEINTRGGVELNLTGDTVVVDDLNFTALIDEDFEVYREIWRMIRKNIQWPQGTFRDFVFDFWIELSNSKGHKVMKLEFYDCRIMNVGAMELNTQDDATEHTLPFTLAYDYFEIIEDPELTLRQGPYEPTELP